MPQPAAASPPRPPVRTGRLLVASAALLLAALLLAVLLIAAGPRPSLAAGGWGNDLSPGDSAKGSTGSWFLQSGANYSRSGERGEERGHVGFHGLAGALFGGTGSFQTILGFAYDEMSATVRSEPIYMPDERRGDTTRRSELVRSYSGRLAFRFFPLGGTAGRVHPFIGGGPEVGLIDRSELTARVEAGCELRSGDILLSPALAYSARVWTWPDADGTLDSFDSIRKLTLQIGVRPVSQDGETLASTGEQAQPRQPALSAPSPRPRALTFLFEAGGGASWFTKPEHSSSTVHAGFAPSASAGIVAHPRGSESIAILLGYQQRRADVEWTQWVPDIPPIARRSTIDLDYATATLLYRFFVDAPSIGRNARLFLGAGPQLAALGDGSVYDLDAFDAAFRVEIGCELPVSERVKLLPALNYAHGLQNVHDAGTWKLDAAGPLPPGEARSRTVSLAVGLELLP